MSVNKYDKINNRLLPFAGNGGGGGSAGIRYIEEDDMIQLYYNDEWVDWKVAGLAYPIGTETIFEYTGDVQSFTIPASGAWKIELWGGKGGSVPSTAGGGAGGKGAYVRAVKNFSSDDVVYVVVGDAGGEYQTSYTGYNGGGNYTDAAGGGGGATHLAFNNGYLLKDTDVNDLIAVAGAGGGGGRDRSGGSSGLNGDAGQNSGYATGGGGGTQYAGGSAGTGGHATGTAGSYGKGGGATYLGGGGGGSGYYGGGSGGLGNSGGWVGSGGGGGSSYLHTSLTDTYVSIDTQVQGKVKFTYLGRGN